MSTWRERWPESPIARVAFFGERDVEEYAVYEAMVEGGGQFLSLIVSRHNRPHPILVHFSHLIFLSDTTPREQGITGDWRVELDGPAVFKISKGSMSQFNERSWQAIGVVDEKVFRLLLSSSAIRSITPVSQEDDSVMDFITEPRELWPELRHNRL